VISVLSVIFLQFINIEFELNKIIAFFNHSQLPVCAVN